MSRVSCLAWFSYQSTFEGHGHIYVLLTYCHVMMSCFSFDKATSFYCSFLLRLWLLLVFAWQRCNALVLYLIINWWLEDNIRLFGFCFFCWMSSLSWTVQWCCVLKSLVGSLKICADRKIFHLCWYWGIDARAYKTLFPL